MQARCKVPVSAWWPTSLILWCVPIHMDKCPRAFRRAAWYSDNQCFIPAVLIVAISLGMDWKHKKLDGTQGGKGNKRVWMEEDI
jgi:hypothetical protein